MAGSYFGRSGKDLPDLIFDPPPAQKLSLKDKKRREIADKSTEQIKSETIESINMEKGFHITGFAQYLCSDTLFDVKTGEAVRFIEAFGGCKGILLHNDNKEIHLTGGSEDTLYFILYNASSSPVSGVSASLKLELDDDEVAGSCTYSRNAYRLDTCMPLSAHCIIVIPKTETKRLRLINNDSNADISNTALSVLRLG